MITQRMAAQSPFRRMLQQSRMTKPVMLRSLEFGEFLELSGLKILLSNMVVLLPEDGQSHSLAFQKPCPKNYFR